MLTPDDVAYIRRIFREMDGANVPGLTPGPFLSGVVGANGRMRKTLPLSPGAAPIVFASSNTSTSVSAGGTYRCDYQNLDYDPFGTMSTGSLCHFTAPHRGWYQFFVTSEADSYLDVWTEGDKMQLQLHWTTPTGPAQVNLDQWGAVATSTATDLHIGLSGFQTAHMPNGATAYTQLVNQTGVTRGAGTLDSILIFDLGVT